MNSNFVCYSLTSSYSTSEYKKKLLEYNAVMTKDSSAIYFWDFNQTKIEKLAIPIDASNSQLFQKIYEANNNIWTMKSTFIDDEEYLYISDEPKYLKILKIEENRLSLFKEYYVSYYYGDWMDSYRKSIFANKMIYSDKGAILVQERGKEETYKFSDFYYQGYSITSSINFPLISKGYILQKIISYDSYDYRTSSYPSILVTTPYFNSYSISFQNESQPSIKFFLNYDENYTVDFTIYKGISIRSLNGELVQEISDQRLAYWKIIRFSQNGEYIVIGRYVS